MDPFSTIIRVFDLISQEEHQRKVGVHANSSSNSAIMAFAIKNDNPKRVVDNVVLINLETLILKEILGISKQLQFF